ncbi:hypothetical protein GCM10007859_09850 [Brevundimonas denitrificans]|uniref:HNH endonuclease n=1 Tax=Brevundimonas denitrificans TaxID=1443434 RepID=A0ABQ6BG16_9CAUL|nr:hypothetical protein [Brevundimonas denitrificans]GLS00975.1 hypothetical protein GCM10007859_09850 [Brevundimonas denitrificans]
MKASSLKVGVDVPWVTSWTGEPSLGVGPCPSVGGAPAILQAGNPGQGKPLYSQNHAVRQRLSVRDMLCPMCGRPTSAQDRWTQVAHPVAAGRLRADGRGNRLPTDLTDDAILVDAGAIAPLHRACVDRSLRYCPHLKADPHIDVRRFPERWIVLPLMARAEAAPQLFLARPTPARTAAVIGFLQLCGLTGERDPAWRGADR